MQAFNSLYCSRFIIFTIHCNCFFQSCIILVNTHLTILKISLLLFMQLCCQCCRDMLSYSLQSYSWQLHVSLSVSSRMKFNEYFVHQLPSHSHCTGHFTVMLSCRLSPCKYSGARHVRQWLVKGQKSVCVVEGIL